MIVTFEPPNQPDVIGLIADLDTYQLSLYPAECVYALDLVSLSQPNVLFAVARVADGTAVGCGAVVLTPQSGEMCGELKRMFVKPELRGQGVARALLELLETEAAARGCRRLMLETGPYHYAALAMYERSGYVRCARFGDYPDDPYSVFMDKPLALRAAA